MLTNLHLNIFRRYNPKVLKPSYIIITIFAALALFAAFQLSIDKIQLLEHPTTKLPCSINAVVNCASVMKTSQAELFGFPNSYLGMMGFAVFLFVGVSGLLGVRYNKVTLRLLFTGVSFALLFAFWLFYQSVYIIQILCPWCLLTTTSTTLVFGALLHISIRENIFNVSKKVNKTANQWLDKDYDKLLIASIIVLGIILVVAKFGDSIIS